MLFHVEESSKDGLYVASLDTGEVTFLSATDSGAVYDRKNRLLLFVRDGTLFAQPFDIDRRALTGEPLPIAERVEVFTFNGLISFSLSETGVLAYGTGAPPPALQLTWVDRQGVSLGTVGPEGNLRGLSLSLDGGRVVSHRHDGDGGDIWLTDVSRNTTTRVTFNAEQDNSAPIWSPDGTRIAYASRRAARWGIYAMSPSGSEEELLHDSGNAPAMPMSWSSDGLVYWSRTNKSDGGLWLLTSGSQPARPLVDSPFDDTHGEISPDGKWLAYRSNESGRAEVYVRPFPTGEGKWQVSTAGGHFPRWRSSGREILDMSALSSGMMMAVDVDVRGSALLLGPPKRLFESGYLNLGHTSRNRGGGIYSTFAISADGQRFLIPRPKSNDAELVNPIVVVMNWAEALVDSSSTGK